MARGQTSGVGDKRVAANGYHYVKTELGWQLEHHIIAGHTRGCPVDTSHEMVRFKDGNKHNLDPDNIIVIEKGQGSLRKRRAQLEARIQELKGEIAEIDRQLAT